MDEILNIDPKELFYLQKRNSSHVLKNALGKMEVFATKEEALAVSDETWEVKITSLHVSDK